MKKRKDTIKRIRNSNNTEDGGQMPDAGNGMPDLTSHISSLICRKDILIPIIMKTGN